MSKDPDIVYLQCRGECRDITLHRQIKLGHAKCLGCGKERRESTGALSGNETVYLKYTMRALFQLQKTITRNNLSEDSPSSESSYPHPLRCVVR